MSNRQLITNNLIILQNRKRKVGIFMKKFNKEEYKDKLLAYYGDEYATKRTRIFILKDNLPILFIISIVDIVFSFIFTIIIGHYEALLDITFIFSFMTIIPAIIGTIISCTFIVLEKTGYGIAIGFEFVFLFVYALAKNIYLSLFITALLLVIFCQSYSKTEFKNAVDEARIELSRNKIKVKIENNKVIFSDEKEE